MYEKCFQNFERSRSFDINLRTVFASAISRNNRSHRWNSTRVEWSTSMYVHIEIDRSKSTSDAFAYIYNRALPASVRRCVYIEGPRRIAGETADGTSVSTNVVYKRGDEGRREVGERRSLGDEELAREKT